MRSPSVPFDFPIPPDIEGFWAWEKGHFPRPATPLTQEILYGAITEGFSAAMDQWACPFGAQCRAINYYGFFTIKPFDLGAEPREERSARYRNTLGEVLPRLGELMASRILQGVAGALIVPNGAALVHAIGPGERRGERFGLIWAAQALAAAVGPPVGGLLITAAGWRAVFYVNLLLVLPALAIGWRWLPRDRAAAGRSQFDLLGGIMLPITLSLAAGLLMLTTGGATSSVLVAGVLVVIMIAAVFLRWEFRHPDPVLQLRLFRRRAFAAANGGIALSNLSMYTVVLSVPLLLASRSESSILQAGLVLTAMSAAMVLVSPFPRQGGRDEHRLLIRCSRGTSCDELVGGGRVCVVPVASMIIPLIFAFACAVEQS